MRELEALQQITFQVPMATKIAVGCPGSTTSSTGPIPRSRLSNEATTGIAIAWAITVALIAVLYFFLLKLCRRYNYQPLPPNSIRLVNILPGNPGTELQCEITTQHFTHAHLDSETFARYEALSYTWGENKFPYNIFRCHVNCAGRRLYITKNLSDALHQLRKQDTNRVLWIDAVCINQNDMKEKEHQIPLMRDIYSRAERVIIWLGLSDEFTEDALLLIDKAAKLLREETGMHIPQPRLIVRETPDDKKNEERGLPLFSQPEKWKPLLELLSRPWFGRAWVFQESSMASSAIAVVGNFKCDWADFEVAARFFAYKGYGGLVYGFAGLLEAASPLWGSSRIATGQRNPARVPLLPLLWLTCRAKAGDPRDKVYSLLGLALEEDYFRADYTKTHREVFARVGRHLLSYPHEKIGDDLALLASVKHYEDDEPKKWPSWVPRWLARLVAIVMRYEDEWPSWVPRWHKDTREPKWLSWLAWLEAIVMRKWPSWVPRWHKATRERMGLLKSRSGTMYIMSNLPSSQKFKAGGPESRIDIPNQLDPYTIAVEGFVFATISANVQFLKVAPLSRPRLWDLVLDIRSVREDRYTPYPTGEVIDEAFAQTLTISGTVPEPDNNQPPETYHAIDFTHFCFSLFEQTIEKMKSKGDSKGCEAMMREYGSEYKQLQDAVAKHDKSKTFSGEMQKSCLARKLFGTKEGYIGVGDVTLQANDLVCVLFGGKVPFILRKREEHYRFVGECYLHGIMFGEALDEGQKSRQWFRLR